MTPLIPESCPICKSPYLGGHELPGKPMKPDLRVFFRCGASMSLRVNEYDPDCFHLLLKNCSGGDMRSGEQST